MKKSQQTRQSKKVGANTQTQTQSGKISGKISVAGQKKIIPRPKTPLKLKPELLLPAGDFEKLKTAFLYGADAVYVGLPVFSLRAKENKFTLSGLEEAIKYTRALDQQNKVPAKSSTSAKSLTQKANPTQKPDPTRQRKKIYVTLNIFPHNNKIPALKKQIPLIAKLKPDAFIVADPGIILLCKKLAPKIPIHLSVQANNVNWASAQFWHQQGVERIILARELSLQEIKEIHEENPKLELEAFVHGAICMAYSGRCHLSHYLAGRDANQGTCVQSCRWKYKVQKGAPNLRNACVDCTPEQNPNKKIAPNPELTATKSAKLKDSPCTFHLEELERPGEYMPIEEDEHGTYILNSKDLCLIKHLKELEKSGVCSFKIEGRNKTKYYVATTARAYRKAIDRIHKGPAPTAKFFNDLTTELAKTSNRGFFTGFLNRNPRHTAIDYEKNYSHQTYEFIGLVVKKPDAPTSKTAQLEIQVKGRMDAPCKIEIMTPEKDIPLTIKEFHLPVRSEAEHKFCAKQNRETKYERSLLSEYNCPGTPISKKSARSKQPKPKPGEPLKTVHPGQKDNVLITIPKSTAEQIPEGAILRRKN